MQAATPPLLASWGGSGNEFLAKYFKNNINLKILNLVIKIEVGTMLKETRIEVHSAWVRHGLVACATDGW